jgi:DNA repair exonuclease SbcCD ATPase subunit
MRLLSATVRNYRVIKELSVDFASSLTLVGGPNESGKSTFAEAIHRALFLKAKGNTEHHRAMLAEPLTASPQVELKFKSGNLIYRLKKTFGVNGTTQLEFGETEILVATHAEEKLAELLQFECGQIGKEMASSWAHLWVWQGKSGEDPTAYATAEKDDLIRQLQKIGGAAVLQSTLDASAVRWFADRQTGLFVSSGKPKAGTELYRAQEMLQLAEEQFALAQTRLEKLAGAADQLEQSSAGFAGATATLAKLEEERQRVVAQQQQLAALRQQEGVQSQALKTKEEKLIQLADADAQIKGLKNEVNDLEVALQPKQVQLQNLKNALAQAQQRSTQSARGFTAAAAAAQAARQRRDLLAAHITLFEKNEQYLRLKKQEQAAATLHSDLAKAESALARLPEVNQAKLERLLEMESQLSQAMAALQAMATGIEVVAAQEVVSVGGERIDVGQKRIVTDIIEIATASGLRILVCPGGGLNLDGARQRVTEIQIELKNLLGGLALASVKAAAEAFGHRHVQQQQISTIKAQLQGMDADGLKNSLDQSQNELITAQGRVERLAVLVTDAPATDNLVAANNALFAADAAAAEAEVNEREARISQQSSAESVAVAESSLSDKTAELDQQRQKLDQMRGQLDLLLQTHGGEQARAAGLARAVAEKAVAQNDLRSIADQIKLLQPDLLNKDAERIIRALDLKRTERDNALHKQAEAQAALRYDGSLDPNAELALATERMRATKQHYASLNRSAQAVNLLNDLFQDEQRGLSEQFTQPLASKISGYLQCVLGADAKVSVHYEKNGFSGLRLTRTDAAGGSCGFENLSGGAREQAAAATRLAMAELLAADHDGALPVIFDDAFTNTDPERVAKVQRMLDFGAGRGVQILVLTCHPLDYASLGAKTVVINRQIKLMNGNKERK